MCYIIYYEYADLKKINCTDPWDFLGSQKRCQGVSLSHPLWGLPVEVPKQGRCQQLHWTHQWHLQRPLGIKDATTFWDDWNTKSITSWFLYFCSSFEGLRVKLLEFDEHFGCFGQKTWDCWIHHCGGQGFMEGACVNTQPSLPGSGHLRFAGSGA